jgi:hypothetical protein
MERLLEKEPELWKVSLITHRKLHRDPDIPQARACFQLNTTGYRAFPVKFLVKSIKLFEMYF